jgi:Family of unknown function (DUF5681)
VEQSNEQPLTPASEPAERRDGGRVGYGRPPVNRQFKKGQSGNPKGRPRGSFNVSTLFMKALRERVVINENGQRKKVTKLEAALKQLVNKAASGDLRAINQLAELARESEAKQNVPGGEQSQIGELDQEVINGILQRFQGQEADRFEQEDGQNEQGADAQEANQL